MHSGNLDRRGDFYSPTETPDGYGGTESGWLLEFSSWLKFKHLHGGEGVISGRLENKSRSIVSIRESPDSERVESDWYVDIDGEKYNIREDAKLSEDRKFYEFLVEGGVAVGN